MTRTRTEPLALELHSGDRLSRMEFHRIYSRMPEDFKAELIGGIVYVSSPLKRQHGTHHVRLSTVFGVYEASTPGVEASDNTTVMLSDEDEPQPDLYLRILPEYGGQTKNTKDDYVFGAPELGAEISHSSHSIDLHDKKDRYAEFGMREYIVVCLHEKQVRWFDLRSGGELAADAAGVFRSRSFPGLWLHAQALLTKNYRQLMATLELGLATPEHVSFVQTLAAHKPSVEDGGPR